MALKAVNKALIDLYWDIGKLIVERQEGKTWGKSVVEQLAQDLQAEFVGISGFSAANLWRMRGSTRHTPITKNTHHWCEKLAGPTTSSSWSAARMIWSANGIILCESKDKTIVEYALRESNKPIGVATYQIVSTLPAELQGELPSPEQTASLLEGIT